jgi:ferredoxin--NADP+ reductase
MQKESSMLKPKKKRKSCKVLEVRKLTESTAVIRFERAGLEFEPGQYIRVGIEGDPEIRDYSVYSGAEADHVEVLVRRVEDGLVSKQLCDLVPGDAVSVGGPYGHFKLTEAVRCHPLLFVATGTGISPYHSFIASYPEIDYRLIHGTGRLEEAYESAVYGDRYFHCVSREDGGQFRGRVTEYLATLDVPRDLQAFLCGNCDMIYEAFDLLQDKGLPTANIHTEVYF